MYNSRGQKIASIQTDDGGRVVIEQVGETDDEPSGQVESARQEVFETETSEPNEDSSATTQSFDSVSVSGRRPVAAGEPLSRYALVTNPAKIPGVESWTLETRNHRIGSIWIAYAPDARHFATSSGFDGTIRIYDSDSLRLDRVIVPPEAGPIGFLEESGELISGGDQGTIYFWDVSESNSVRKAVTAVPGRSILAIRAAPQRSLFLLKTRDSWNPDDESVNVVTFDGNDVSSALLGSANHVRCIDLSPDGKSAAAVLADTHESPGTLKIWDLETGDVAQQLVDVLSASWSPDGRRLAFAREGDITVVNSVDFSTVWKQPANSAGVPAWSQRADRVAMASGVDSVVWDGETGTQLTSIPDGTSPELCWSPDGMEVLGAGPHGGVATYDPATGTHRAIPNCSIGGSHFPARLSADGATIVSSGGVLLQLAFQSVLQMHAWSGNGRFYASTAPPADPDFNTPHGFLKDIFEAKQFELTDCAGARLDFSPDGAYLVCVAPAINDSATRVVIWSTSSQLEQTGVFEIDFWPEWIECDQRSLYLAGPDAVEVYQLPDGGWQRRLPIRTGCLAVSERGVLATGHEGEVRVWDAATGQQFDAFPFGSGRFHWSSPTQLTAICVDNTLRIVDIDSGERSLYAVPSRFSNALGIGFSSGNDIDLR